MYVSKRCNEEKNFGILFLVKGIKIRPDPLPYQNDKRREFCSRYDGYGDFCSGNNQLKKNNENIVFH